ncbi:MAG: ABC transporter permease [Lachnospiraceae bacterium]|nr:ABC transporter permease [Lachnospiraceae bacterium]
MNKLYIKLMATNIRNGKRFYLPYILSGILIVTLFYNIQAIYYNEGLSSMAGGNDVKKIMSLGSNVIGIFSFIFIFYTNSFIMKRRKKDIGIYNILGMEKRHIAKELFVETMAISITIIICGLVTGIIFDKFLMMFLYKLLGFETSIKFIISGRAICNSLILFIILYFMVMVYNVMQVKISNPIELLRGSNVGEKEPKTKVLMAITGFLCIGTGYYIAITTQNPIAALTLFFVAVLLVIIGTYCLFTSGSIALLKILRNNKNYYYKKKHFTAVSGMIYRMKQNAAGLANICILSTMVLVMVSTTVSMYIGEEDILNTRFETELNISGKSDKPADSTNIIKMTEDEIAKQGRKILKEYEYTYINIGGIMNGNKLDTEGEEGIKYNFSDITFINLLTKDDFKKISDIDAGDIQDGELKLFGTSMYDEEEIKFLGLEYKVKESIADNKFSQLESNAAKCYFAVTNDYNGLERVADKLKEENITDIYNYGLHIDIDGTSDQKKQCARALSKLLDNNDKTGFVKVYVESREENKSSFYILYGGLFFLGIFLGTMFLMITVLIIFYKQISEGYEDRERFIIMEKVGMSKKDVKSSIRSQIRTVFLLPIAVATIHVAAAFPMTRQLLAMLNMSNYKLYIICVIATIVVFAVIYVIVFLLTSRTYYKIVGEENR